MEELIHVTAVELAGDHRLRLAFEDGSAGDIQFGDDDWFGVFEPLRDPAFFARVELDEEMGTIVWPNGADIAPETLHVWATRGRDRQLT
jgi:hypothetical protein